MGLDGPNARQSRFSRSSTVRLDGKKVPFRKRIRQFFEDIYVEFTIMGIVIIYALFIFADLVTQQVFNDFDDNATVVEEGDDVVTDSFEDTWMKVFYVVDWAFLTLFMIELLIKLYAWGPLRYLRNKLDAFDAVVVLVSFGFVVGFRARCDYLDPPVSLWECIKGEGSGGAQTITSLARTVRLVRVFRLMTVMNKVQKSRATAHVLSKKAKYRKLGSPVERVLEILVRLKKDPLDDDEDRENINFIVDIIVSDQLYAVNMKSADVGEDMMAYLGQQGVATSTRKPPEKLENKKPDGGQRRSIAPVNGSSGGARRSSITRMPGDATLWVDKLISSEAVGACLKNVERWDFDVFDFEARCGANPLVAIVVHLIRLNGLEDTLGLNLSNVVRFMTKVESGYRLREGPDAVPFHNRSHATDVVQGTCFFMALDKIKEHITPLDVYALILAAAMHDHAHPGVNNAFLVNARDELAILYNDASVLEMFHLASSWRMLLNKESDVFDSLSPDQYAEVRQTIVHVILGTDMKYHFDHLTKFKTRAGAGAFDSPDRKDVRLLLAMCLHSADVSNPAKPWHLSMEWSARVMDEFFRQGDREQEKGLPPSPFMDRTKTNIAQCQVGFINILIKPYFEEWAGFLGPSANCLTENITANISKWETDGEAALGDRLALIKEAPNPPDEEEAAKADT